MLFQAIEQNKIKAFRYSLSKQKQAIHIDITIVGRAIKHRTNTKNEVKSIKSDNFKRSIREKSNIAFTMMEKSTIG